MKIKRNIKSSNSVPPFKKEEFKKQLQDELYNAFIELARTPEWGFEDIGEIDDLLMPIIDVEDYTDENGYGLKVEFRGEVDYDGLDETCQVLDKVVQKYDKSAYFEPVQPGIAEAFIRTSVEASCNVNASSKSLITMQDVQSLIDDYGAKYFEAIPTSGGRELWFIVFDIGSYNIQIVDGKIVMISTDDPNEEVRVFRTLDEFRNYLERQIAIGKQEANMNYSANASTHLNYITPEMKQLKRAISNIYVDNDEQFHELVDAILNEEPINLVTETKALKRAMDNMIVDSDEEKRNLVYNVAKDLGVIESSIQIKAYTFDETEDGWGEDVEETLSSVFARAEDLMYEVRNTVRGANTDCDTVEDLADFIRQLASEFEEAADELESL